MFAKYIIILFIKIYANILILHLCHVIAIGMRITSNYRNTMSSLPGMYLYFYTEFQHNIIGTCVDSCFDFFANLKINLSSYKDIIRILQSYTNDYPSFIGFE